jgi:hypothetical protein
VVQVGALGFPYVLAQAHGMVIISDVCSVLAHDAATFIRDLVCSLNLFWKHNTLRNRTLFRPRSRKWGSLIESLGSRLSHPTQLRGAHRRVMRYETRAVEASIRVERMSTGRN